MNIFRTMIVPATLATAARNLGAALTPAAIGMFRGELSPTGSGPVTHYVSTGMIEDKFADLLTNADALFAAAQVGAQAQGLTLAETLEDCQALVSQADVSADQPFDAFARLGLKLVTAEV